MSSNASQRTAPPLQNLAKANHITAERDGVSLMAAAITHLAGDRVELDYVEQLLVNLKRKGVLTKAETLKLQGSYLQEKREHKQNFSA